MSNWSQHISFKMLTVVFVITLLVPSAIKLNHVFENHKHDVCTNNTFDHFHELEIDCEFYKFNTANHFFVHLDYNFTPLQLKYTEVINTCYNYLNSHRALNFSLRGPPTASLI